MNVKNSNQLAVEKMLPAFRSNQLLVSEPHFFGVPVDEYFVDIDNRGSMDAAPQAGFVADRGIEQEILARMTELNIHQPIPTIFGIPVDEFFIQSEKDIWFQILAEMNERANIVHQSE
ncbi:MAG: hypothetical protein AAF490_16545 [Chloroflexota bacterium]